MTLIFVDSIKCCNRKWIRTSSKMIRVPLMMIIHDEHPSISVSIEPPVLTFVNEPFWLIEFHIFQEKSIDVTQREWEKGWEQPKNLKGLTEFINHVGWLSLFFLIFSTSLRADQPRNDGDRSDDKNFLSWDDANVRCEESSQSGVLSTTLSFSGDSLTLNRRVDPSSSSFSSFWSRSSCIDIYFVIICLHWAFFSRRGGWTPQEDKKVFVLLISFKSSPDVRKLLSSAGLSVLGLISKADSTGSQTKLCPAAWNVRTTCGINESWSRWSFNSTYFLSLNEKKHQKQNVLQTNSPTKQWNFHPIRS